MEERIAALEARVTALESSKGKPAANTDTFSLDKLENAWADKEVKKVPSTWKLGDVIGKKYSELTPEEAQELAGFYEWKAQKGREEVPVRKRDDGKPWHENDSFEAKLLRTWAVKPKTTDSSSESPPF